MPAIIVSGYIKFGSLEEICVFIHANTLMLIRLFINMFIRSILLDNNDLASG
jgi:hypothetical protein